MRNYELSLTTVLAGVSAEMGGTEGEKGYSIYRIMIINNKVILVLF